MSFLDFLKLKNNSVNNVETQNVFLQLDLVSEEENFSLFECQNEDEEYVSDSLTLNNSKINNNEETAFNKETIASVQSNSKILLGDGSTISVNDYINNLLSQKVGFETKEEYQAYVLDKFTSYLEEVKATYQEQEDDNGFFSNLYDGAKKLLGLGTSSKDVEDGINKYEQMVQGLTDAINGESDMSFEQVYEYYTGTSFSTEKIDEYLETSNIYSAVMVGCQYDENYLKNFENATGKSVNEVIENYAQCQLDTFGDVSEVKNIIEEYSQDQQTYADKLSSIVSTAGLACTVVGAITTFFCPPAGMALLSAGKGIALAGMFVDNAIDLVDSATDGDGLTKNEIKDLALETGVETVSYAAGRGIGKLTNSLNSVVSSKVAQSGANSVTSYIAGQAAETVTDTALSLGADYVIAQGQSLITTGELMDSEDYWSLDRFLGEGKNQLIGILTGLSSAKVSAYQQGIIKTAQGMVLEGDTDGAKTYLKEKGMKIDDTSFEGFVKNVQEVEAQIKAQNLTSEKGVDFDLKENLEVDSSLAEQIAKFDEQQYVMFNHLLNDKNYECSIDELISSLSYRTNNQCMRFNELYEKGLSFEEAFDGMNLSDTIQTEKYATLIKKGVKSFNAITATKLDDTQYENYLYFINNGTSGSEALGLIDLDIEQYKRYKYLIDEQFINFEVAHEAAKLDFETQYPKFKELIVDGVYSPVAIEASKLNEDEYSRFETLVQSKLKNPVEYKNVADGILLKIATFDLETQYPKFEELCNKGVDMTTATNAVTEFDDTKYSRFVTLIDKKINSFFAYNAADLDDSQFKRFETLTAKGINTDSALELAQLLKDDYSSLSLREKIDVLEDLKQIQKYYANDKEDTKILNLQAEIEKVENSMKQVISATDVSKEQTIQMMKGFFANNNSELENTLATTDFSQYGKSGIPLEYSRTEFLSDLSAELTKLSAETQLEITEKLGIDIIDDENGNITGYNGIIDLTKLSSEGAEGEILSLATKFIKENSVSTGNAELDSALNSLIEGMPEFINVIGKQQHETHELSVDSHILTVLQNVMSNPDYENLSDSDKFCLKFATVLHDIAKSEGVVDDGHANFSALYSRDILNKYNLPDETKNRIFEFVQNHHWLAGYNNCDISADETAAMFRRNDDLTAARIFAEADLKGVNSEFYEKYSLALDSAIQEPVSEALTKINAKGEMFLTNSIIDKSKVPSVEYNGKTYQVINFSELSSDTDLQQYGFEPNTTVDNFRVLVHTVSENFIAQNLDNVLKLGDSANEGFLCASFISVENKNTYHDNKFGVVLQSENVNIANASKANQRSGFEKGFKNFSSIITGNASESMYRDKISSDIKSNLKLTDSEYAQLYTTLQKYKHASQLDNVSSITVGDKTFTGTQIKNAINGANDSIINSKYHNEVNVYTPQVNAVIAKADSLQEVPQSLLDFAENNNLPIYLLGAEEYFD